MKLDFKYTNELVSYLLNIEKYKTALEYLYLPTRTKQKLMYDAKLKKTHFSTSIEGNVLSLKQVENVINSNLAKSRDGMYDIFRVHDKLKEIASWDKQNSILVLRKSSSKISPISVMFQMLYKIYDIYYF